MLFRHHFNCKFAPLLLSLATVLCLLTALTSAHAQSNLHLGRVQVTTAPNTPPAFEIGLPRSLPAGSNIKLASPHAHAQAGFAYPLWLSDAAIGIKQRRGQPQTILIQTMRSPPQSDHELLLEVSQSGGASQLIPYVFLTDPIAPSSADLPMPELPASSEPAPEARPTLAEVIERLGNQPKQPSQGAAIATSNSVPSKITDATGSAARPRHNPQRIQKPAAKKAIQVQPAQIETVVPATSASAPLLPPKVAAAAIPETAASAPAVAASAPDAPSATPPAVTPTAASSPSWLSRQLSNPINLALAAVALLLLSYISLRVWQTKRAAKAKNPPVLTRETGFQPTSHGTANTVFGLSDQEAVAMQQQWVQQQMEQKT